MDTILSLTALCGYIFAAAVLAIGFWRAKDLAVRVGNWTLALVFVVHGVEIGVRWGAAGIAPATNPGEALSLFAWILVGGHLALQLRYKVRGVGALVGALAALMVLGGLAFSHEGEVPEALRSAWLPIHVSFAFLGHAALGLAFVTAVAYLIQERQVRSKRWTPLRKRLPPLETLDLVNYRCVAIGFPLLTLGILSGALYAKSELGDYWRWEPRQIWSLVTWLIFATLLHTRLTVGWRGRRTAIITIVGFAVILGSFLSIRLFDLGFHSDFR